jgi:leucyl-tRNA synthetase
MDRTVEMPVQINGKVRDKIVLPADASEDDALAAAKAQEKVQEYLATGGIVKVIFVPNRLLNLVVK